MLKPKLMLRDVVCFAMVLFKRLLNFNIDPTQPN